VLVEYMAYMCMAPVLKERGHQVEVFFDPQQRSRRFQDELAKWKPDVVGFSVLTPSVPWALATAREVKRELGAVTVFGNVHAMLNPHIVREDGVDLVCVGEGEPALAELADRVDARAPYHDIPALWCKQGDGIRENPAPSELIDLDAMPFHDRAMYDKYAFFRHSRYVRFLIGRGCPFRCSFCSNTNLLDHFGGTKSYVRKRTPERAIEELEEVVRERKPDHIYLIDEVLWVQNDWLRRFLHLYRDRIGVPFQANFRFGPIEEDDVRLLAEAGAKTVIFAVESADERQRREVFEKPVSNALIEKLAVWLHRYGIRFTANVFFGVAGDSVEDHLARLPFFRRIAPDYLWTSFFQPYPALKLTERMIEQGLLRTDRPFEHTVHHDMYLDLPDRVRHVNLKKVYFYMQRWPWTTPLLTWLLRFDAPWLFDLLFLFHFTYYALRFERVSFVQFVHHAKVFALNPVLRRLQTLPSTGRSFTPRPAAA